MNNKSIAILILVSFAIIATGAFTEEFSNLCYSVGAIGTAVFGYLGLNRLWNADKRSAFPYIGFAVFTGFWVTAIFFQDSIGPLATMYSLALIFASVSLIGTREARV